VYNKHSAEVVFKGTLRGLAGNMLLYIIKIHTTDRPTGRPAGGGWVGWVVGLVGWVGWPEWGPWERNLQVFISHK